MIENDILDETWVIPERKLGFWARAAAMLLDHFMMVFLFVPLMLVFLIATVIGNQTLGQLEPLITALFPILYSFYLAKDSIGGRSIAKRLLGQQIIDLVTQKPATPIKTVIRNITVFIYPIEIIVTLINPSRRLGDYLANTKVVPAKKIPKDALLASFKADSRKGVGKAVGLSFLFIIITSWCLGIL